MLRRESSRPSYGFLLTYPMCSEMYATSNVMSNNHQGYSHAIDMWSIGTITALLLSGRQPFGLEHESQMPEYQREKLIRDNAMRRNLSSLNASKGWQKAGPRAKDFVMKLLVVNEDQRLTATEALKHSWFANRHHCREFADLYRRATASWTPRSEGKRLIVDLDAKTRDLPSELSSAPNGGELSIDDPIDIDELSQDHEVNTEKSRYF